MAFSFRGLGYRLVGWLAGWLLARWLLAGWVLAAGRWLLAAGCWLLVRGPLNFLSLFDAPHSFNGRPVVAGLQRSLSSTAQNYRPAMLDQITVLRGALVIHEGHPG